MLSPFTIRCGIKINMRREKSYEYNNDSLENYLFSSVLALKFCSRLDYQVVFSTSRD